VIVVAALILTFARVGSLHGKTFTMYVETNEARGVIRGTEVWLNGQRVGVVKAVGFRPTTSPTGDRVVVQLAVLQRAREQIRKDSRTQIRSGGSLISSPVIYVHTGTVRTPVVNEGDTLRAEGSIDFEAATAKAAEAARDFPVIIENVKAMSAQLSDPAGPVGSLRDRTVPAAREVGTRASRLMERFSSSGGSIGAAFRGSGEVADRARHALAGVDSLRMFVASGRASFGRFRRDTTLQQHVASLRDEVATIRALAANPNGTLGRFRADSAYRQSLDAALRQLDSLFVDLRKHPLRYIAF
jgi:ABC-type transporter Mla subunit MlaD